MARINIEEQWWTDPRREALSKVLGDELLADGAVIRLWRLAQEYWKRNSEPIPNHVFEHVRYRSELVACSLAVVRTEGVFVRGCSEHFAWITKQRENASKAGKKSAENRKLATGSAQPKPSLNGVSPNDFRTAVRTTLEHDPTPPNETQPSSSPSSSSSYKKNIYIGQFDLEIPYQIYPRKRGKTPGMKIIRKQIKSQQDFLDFQKAVQNFAHEMKDKEPQFIMKFSTFAQEWRDWIQIEKSQPTQIEGPRKKTEEELIAEVLERRKKALAEKEYANGIANETSS